MPEINSPTQLKASARNSLTGHYSFLISALLTVGIIFSLFYILLYPLTPFAILMLHLFSFHICRIYLMTFSGERTTLKDLLIGNPDRTKEMQAFYAACILTVIQFLCMLPSNILSLSANNSSVLFLLYCVTFAAGMAVYCYIHLILFPIYYLVSDCPAETTTETIRMAIFISKGHRFRLFYLIASFLPLFLLSLLSFGVGLLWVIPYTQATLTHFYLNLTASKSN